MRILLDLDGVAADWTGAVADVITRHGGGDLDTSKWFESNDLPAAIRGKVMADMSAKDFCYKFDLLPGAKQGIIELRALGCEVHFVTSLWDCPTWVFDRNRWLRMHKLCDAPRGVTYTKDKFVVKGDIFVDDKISNVETWQKHWPLGMGIVWSQPWNTAYTGPWRMNDWDALVRLAALRMSREQPNGWYRTQQAA